MIDRGPASGGEGLYKKVWLSIAINVEKIGWTPSLCLIAYLHLRLGSWGNDPSPFRLSTANALHGNRVCVRVYFSPGLNTKKRLNFLYIGVKVSAGIMQAKEKALDCIWKREKCGSGLSSSLCTTDTVQHTRKIKKKYERVQIERELAG